MTHTGNKKGGDDDNCHTNPVTHPHPSVTSTPHYKHYYLISSKIIQLVKTKSNNCTTLDEMAEQEILVKVQSEGDNSYCNVTKSGSV